MREMLDGKLNRFEQLEKDMTDPAIQGDSNKISAVMREHGSLAKLATKYRRFKGILGEVEEVKAMAESDDPDEQELAKDEPAESSRGSRKNFGMNCLR